MRVDPDVLRRELAAWRWPLEEPGARDQWVEAAIPRIAAMLALLPEPRPDGRLLELGSPPFFTSLCLARVWPGPVTHTGYAHDGASRIRERLVSADGGDADRVFELDCFNVETDAFPYPDGSFDVVVFSELIEHLALNPLWTLAEFHCVLRPGGHVVVTTPNALSLERLRLWMKGGSDPVDRYQPLFGYGARHNREWHTKEVRAVLEETGFAIEELVVRDIHPQTVREKATSAALRLVMRAFSHQPHRDHIFARARRGDVFRWRFPTLLFDHMGLYRLVRHSFVEMDVNDTIQCGGGWEPLEQSHGGAVRRVGGPAIAWLRADASARRLVVRARAGETPAGVALTLAPVGGGAPLATAVLTLPATTWTDASVALDRPPADGAELELKLDPGAGAVVVRRLWLE